MNAAPATSNPSGSPYPSAWSIAPGGSGNAGAGIKIGIVDTGIDQTHPAFQDSTLTVPAGFPKCNTDPAWSCTAFTTNKVIVARSYVRQISAYSATDPANPLPGTTTPTPATSQPDDYSPRDRDGHGTAVASAAAAMASTAGLTVPINGMAPKAYLGSYKVYGTPGVNDYPPEDVYIQALDDAMNDGMDIVNFSSGAPATTGAMDTGAACGNAAGVPCDPLGHAFETAAEAGLVIAVSAANGGVNYTAYNYYPVYNSVATPAVAPSVISVGATINGHAFGPSVSVPGASSSLQNIASIPSDSAVANIGGLMAPLVDVGVLTADQDNYACSALPANSLTNSFALVQRGPTAAPCSFAVKAANVEAAGAIGMIMFQAPDSPASWNSGDTSGLYNYIESVDLFTGPVVGISNAMGALLQEYIFHTAIVSYASNGSVDPWPLVTIDMSGAVRSPDPGAAANELATYSSFGPSMAYFPATGCGTCTGALIKPELVATGGGDYNLYPDPNDGYLLGFAGLYVAAESFDPNGQVYSSTRYAAANGTSFASPLTAGSAALVKQKHPGYTAAQIKSALVNWSNATAVQTDDGAFNSYFGVVSNLPVDARQIGAGLLDAGAAAQATITATPTTVSFGAVKTGGSLPASQQITIANLGSGAVTLNVAVVQKMSAAGATVTVSPSTLSLGAAGSGTASATITVSITGAVPAVGVYYGSVNATAIGVSLHIPYLFQVGNGILASGNAVTGNIIPVFGTYFDGIAGTDNGPIAIQLMDAAGLPIAGFPVTFSAGAGVTLRSVSGEPACAGSALSVNCNTDNYGIAYTDVLLGPTPVATPYTCTGAVSGCIIAGPTGLSSAAIAINVNIRQQPTIGSVRDAAQGKTTIAPGSYVAIYGSGLSDYLAAETTSTLPLALQGVSVSFDAAGISVPGELIYVSPAQVNVQVPWELQGLNSSVQMKVTLYEYEYGNLATATVADTAPSFFETTPGAEVAALITGTYTYVTPTSPLARGTAVQLYANGLGPVNNQPASGGVAPSTKTANTKATCTVTIGGQTAAVSYCGLAPGYPGLYEVDVTAPPASVLTTTGAKTVSLTIAGQTATSTITVD
jgi:uncharacterized protein (TIGR03437 family)